MEPVLKGYVVVNENTQIATFAENKEHLLWLILSSRMPDIKTFTTQEEAQKFVQTCQSTNKNKFLPSSTNRPNYLTPGIKQVKESPQPRKKRNEPKDANMPRMTPEIEKTDYPQKATITPEIERTNNSQKLSFNVKKEEDSKVNEQIPNQNSRLPDLFIVKHEEGSHNPPIQAPKDKISYTPILSERSREKSDKPTPKYINKNLMMAKFHIKSDQEYRLYFDGASKGNSGPAGYGFAIYNNENKEIYSQSDKLGEMNNNQAEYKGLFYGLEAAKELGIKRIKAHGDSELVIKQVNGRYKVHNEKLRPFYEEVMEAANNFTQIEYDSIPKVQNARAELLANEAVKAN